MDLSANIMTNWEQIYLKSFEKSTHSKSSWHHRIAWRSKQRVSQQKLMLHLFCCLLLCMCSTHQTLQPVQQPYLWQGVLGKLHGVESVSFIGHIMDRLATYWHLERRYSTIYIPSHFRWIFISITVYTDCWQHLSHSLNHHQNSGIVLIRLLCMITVQLWGEYTPHNVFSYMPFFPRIMAPFS